MEMPADLQQYHGNGHSISTYHWTSSAPQTVKITSQKKYSCQLFVESNPIGNSAEITYTYDYWEGASLVTQTLCWNVKIERDSGGGGSGSSTENDKSNSITTPTENWCQSGNYNISWYNKNAKEFVISTNKELAGIAYLVNNNYTDFKGKTIKLNSDIDLSGKQWKTIGVNDNYFKGNFDGQGHTIFGIFIGKQEQDQNKYGFWGYLESATISNTTFEGNVFIDDPETTSYLNFRVGGIAGSMNEVSIKNCNVKMPIVFTKKSIYHVKSLYIGGLVGYSEKGNISYCSHEGNFDVKQDVRDSEPCIVGGLTGYSYYTTIEFSENISDNVYIYYPYGNHNSYYLRFGGIVGVSNSQTIKCCKSILEHVEIVNKTKATTYFYIGGICGNGRGEIINSFCSVSSIKFDSVDMYNTGGAVFGGICSVNDEYNDLRSTITASFNNSDVSVSNNYKMTTDLNGTNGSTAFSSDQMKTSAFLEELNMYSTIEMDGPVWAQTEGDYPYIKELKSTTGIINNKKANIADSHVYTLSGQRLSAPKKGINIVDGRKVVVK